jgi:hypothetical protein
LIALALDLAQRADLQNREDDGRAKARIEASGFAVLEKVQDTIGAFGNGGLDLVGQRGVNDVSGERGVL